MGKEGKERRKHPRSVSGFPGIQGEGDDGVLNHVDNISCNGVLCHTLKPIPVMTKMSVVVELPSPIDTRIEAEGIVIRCDVDEEKEDQFRVAILYTKLSDEGYEAISKYVEHDLAGDQDAE